MQEKSSLLLKNAHIFDGLEPTLKKGWLLLRGDRIVSSGWGNPPSPLDGEGEDNLEIKDLKGDTVMPGLIDCHVHLGHDASADPHKTLLADPDPLTAIKSAVNAGRTLKAGITTVRDMGSVNDVSLCVRDAVNSGTISGPRILVSGRMICMTGGHGWEIGLEVDGPHDIQKAVRAHIKKGVDLLKFMATGGVLTPGVEPGATQLTPEELSMGVSEAHRAGRPAAAHAQGREGILWAVMAGIDSVEHGIGLDDALIDKMLAKGTFLVPTLSAPMNILKSGEKEGIPSFIIQKTKRVVNEHISSLQKAKTRGVPIAMGTDAGTPFNRHGRNAEELIFMVRHGFSAADALISATSMAARLLKLEHEIGAIRQGMKADLVLLDGNPLSDISVLSDETKIRAVFKSGKELRVA